MFAFVGTERATSRSRQDHWASRNPLDFVPNTQPINHFYSPNDSDEDSSGGGFHTNQSPYIDQSMPFSALQQTSNPSPLPDRPHLPPDDSWLATSSDEYTEDTPYIPPTLHSTHYSSNITLSDDLRPPLAIPRDSTHIFPDSQLYDVCFLSVFHLPFDSLTFPFKQPQDSGIDQSYSPHTSEYSYCSTSQRSSDTHASRDSGSHSSGESDNYPSGTIYEPPPSGSHQQPYNPALYPAYDQNHQRIGLEHTRPDAMEHVPTGRPYYRAQTRTYGVRASPSQAEHQPQGVSAAQPVAPQFIQSPTPPQQSQELLPPQPVYRAPTTHQTRQSFSSQVPVEEIPDPEPSLRQMLGIGPNQEISLAVLDDPPPGEKPNYPYPTLAKLAIHGSERKKLTLQEIYTALEDRFEWFRQRSSSDTAWKVHFVFPCGHFHRANLSISSALYAICYP
jgi:Forkhead domain